MIDNRKTVKKKVEDKTGLSTRMYVVREYRDAEYSLFEYDYFYFEDKEKAVQKAEQYIPVDIDVDFHGWTSKVRMLDNDGDGVEIMRFDAINLIDDMDLIDNEERVEELADMAAGLYYEDNVQQDDIAEMLRQIVKVRMTEKL
jgi:hypothetical protein